MLNSNVKWTSQDEAGEFSHVGKCIAIEGDMVTLVPLSGGSMVVPLSEVVKTRAARTDSNVVEEPELVTTSNAVRAGSKAEAALAIVLANPTATRKECIQMFIDQLGMTQAGANTYVSNARKRVVQ